MPHNHPVLTQHSTLNSAACQCAKLARLVLLRIHGASWVGRYEISAPVCLTLPMTTLAVAEEPPSSSASQCPMVLTKGMRYGFVPAALVLRSSFNALLPSLDLLMCQLNWFMQDYDYSDLGSPPGGGVASKQVHNQPHDEVLPLFWFVYLRDGPKTPPAPIFLSTALPCWVAILETAPCGVPDPYSPAASIE